MRISDWSSDVCSSDLVPVSQDDNNLGCRMKASPPDRRGEFAAGAFTILPLLVAVAPFGLLLGTLAAQKGLSPLETALMGATVFAGASQFVAVEIWRSEEHTSELQSLMRISYAVFCLKKKKKS